MTDGTTGIPVAPTAEDISMAQTVFQKAADALVNMSHLANEVAELRQQVQQMNDTLSSLRRQNDSLDEALANSRQRRQELEQQLASARDEAQREKARADSAEAKRDAYFNEMSGYIEDREQARKERDDAQLRVLELEERVEKAEGQLRDIRNYASQVFGFNTPAPEPQPAPAEGASLGSILPSGEAQPEGPPEEPDWGRNTRWSKVHNRWVNDEWYNPEAEAAA